MKRRIEELSAKEILALAIQIEISNQSRMEAFASAFRGFSPTTAAMFDELAVEEEEHKLILENKFRTRFGDEIPPMDEFEIEGVIEAIDIDQSESLIFDGIDAQEVLRQARLAEQNAQEFYRLAADATDDEELCTLFRELEEMEGEHESGLSELGETFHRGESE